MVDELLQRADHKRKFHTLDGLRGVAALAVVMLHLTPLIKPLSAPSAYLAVDLFFLMSGFVIAHVYDHRLAAGMSAGQFLLLRWVRLWPLYALGTGLFALPIIAALLLGKQLVWTKGSFLEAAVFQFLMLPSPPIAGKSATLFLLNPPGWSLFFELLSNLGFGIAFSLLVRKALIAVVAVSALALTVSAVIAGNLEGGAHWPDIQYGMARVMFSFFLGVLLSRLFREGALPRFSAPPLAILVLTFAVLLLAPPPALRPWFDLLVVAVVFPLIIVAAVHNEPTKARKGYVLGGVVSYPLYAIHMPVLATLQGIGEKSHRFNLAAHAPVIGLGLIALLVIASWILAETYDVKARGMLGRLVALRAS